MAWGADGQATNKTTARELAAFEGENLLRMLSYTTEVADERWNWWQEMVREAAVRAGHEGRRALRQTRLK